MRPVQLELPIASLWCQRSSATGRQGWRHAVTIGLASVPYPKSSATAESARLHGLACRPAAWAGDDQKEAR